MRTAARAPNIAVRRISHDTGTAIAYNAIFTLFKDELLRNWQFLPARRYASAGYRDRKVYRRFGRRTIRPRVDSAAGMRTEKWLLAYKLKALIFLKRDDEIALGLG